MLISSTYLQQLVVLVLHYENIILQLFDLPLAGNLLELQFLTSVFLLFQMFLQLLHEKTEPSVSPAALSHCESTATWAITTPTEQQCETDMLTCICCCIFFFSTNSPWERSSSSSSLASISWRISSNSCFFAARRTLISSASAYNSVSAWSCSCSAFLSSTIWQTGRISRLSITGNFIESTLNGFIKRKQKKVCVIDAHLIPYLCMFQGDFF